MSTDIHTTSPTISENAAESTFHEVDDRDRAIPAIEFRDVVLAFDDRVILNHLSFKVMKGETKIIRMPDKCWSTVKTLLTTTKSR
jgi:ABC-type multidrug transport system fused ATPase/permease subunit